jgi:hypothetical protein
MPGPLIYVSLIFVLLFSFVLSDNGNVGMKDYYAILGLVDLDAAAFPSAPPSVSSADIRNAFNKVALRLHPDKNPSSDANQQFIELLQARTTLLDSAYKKLYDKLYVEYCRHRIQTNKNKGVQTVQTNTKSNSKEVQFQAQFKPPPVDYEEEFANFEKMREEKTNRSIKEILPELWEALYQELISIQWKSYSSYLDWTTQLIHFMCRIRLFIFMFYRIFGIKFKLELTDKLFDPILVIVLFCFFIELLYANFYRQMFRMLLFMFLFLVADSARVKDPAAPVWFVITAGSVFQVLLDLDISSANWIPLFWGRNLLLWIISRLFGAFIAFFMILDTFDEIKKFNTRISSLTRRQVFATVLAVFTASFWPFDNQFGFVEFSVGYFCVVLVSLYFISQLAERDCKIEMMKSQTQTKKTHLHTRNR